jgi:hypothetical protein
MAKSALVDYALEMRARGFICLPLAKGGKHLDLARMAFEPLHLKTRRKDLKELAFTGLTFALSQNPPDTAAIRDWFCDHDGNVGILAGHGGLVVLDFDNSPALGRWREKHRRLFEATPVEETPNGFHIYLRCSRPIVSSSLHVGMRRAGHIKALGGYVASNPSTLKDGSTYRWLDGQSPFDVEPRHVDDVESLGIHPASPIKRCYDRLLGRGYFKPQ